jgi:hypothetical protein
VTEEATTIGEWTINPPAEAVNLQQKPTEKVVRIDSSARTHYAGQPGFASIDV